MTTTATVTPGPATAATTPAATTPPTRSDIEHELGTADGIWQAVDERIAALAVPLVAHAARALDPDAATVILDWTDQPGIPRLRVTEVRDLHDIPITDAESDDDLDDAASHLTKTNQHVWEAHVIAVRAEATYRLDVEAILTATSRLPSTTHGERATAAEPHAPVATGDPEHRVEVVSYRDPEDGTDLRVFLDGTELASFDWYEADPGAGHSLADWRAAGLAYAAEATPSAAEAIRAAWDSGEGSEHVTRH